MDSSQFPPAYLRAYEGYKLIGQVAQEEAEDLRKLGQFHKAGWTTLGPLIRFALSPGTIKDKAQYQQQLPQLQEAFRHNASLAGIDLTDEHQLYCVIWGQVSQFGVLLEARLENQGKITKATVDKVYAKLVLGLHLVEPWIPSWVKE